MNIIKKSSVVALLSIFALSAMITLPAKAESNPFAAQNLMTISAPDGHKKDKCGEGKCGEAKAKKLTKGKCGEGKCGEAKAKKLTKGKVAKVNAVKRKRKS
jgi:uncharacterized low-complexity protein